MSYLCTCCVTESIFTVEPSQHLFAQFKDLKKACFFGDPMQCEFVVPNKMLI